MLGETDLICEQDGGKHVQAAVLRKKQRFSWSIIYMPEVQTGTVTESSGVAQGWESVSSVSRENFAIA